MSLHCPGLGYPWEEAQKLTLSLFWSKLVAVSIGVGLKLASVVWALIVS